MPVIGLCVAIIPVLAVIAITALCKALLLPFTSAFRLIHRSRAAARA